MKTELTYLIGRYRFNEIQAKIYFYMMGDEWVTVIDSATGEVVQERCNLSDLFNSDLK